VLFHQKESKKWNIRLALAVLGILVGIFATIVPSNIASAKENPLKHISNLSPHKTLTGELFSDVVRLQDLRSFEVVTFHDTFDVTLRHVDAELFPYLSTAIQNQNTLPVGSPGEGIVHLECKGLDCRTIEATVTAGHQGPAVWKQQFKNMSFWVVRRNPKAVVDEIATTLGHAYQPTSTIRTTDASTFKH
jgi:hypothetical protein